MMRVYKESLSFFERSVSTVFVMSIAFFQEEFFHLSFCLSRFFFNPKPEKEEKNKLLSVTKQHTDDNNNNNNNKERERERELLTIHCCEQREKREKKR